MKCEEKDSKDLKVLEHYIDENVVWCKNHGNFLSFTLKISVWKSSNCFWNMNDLDLWPWQKNKCQWLRLKADNFFDSFNSIKEK